MLLNADLTVGTLAYFMHKFIGYKAVLGIVLIYKLERAQKASSCGYVRFN